MATTDKDFVVKQGLKVATGVTFPDNTVQTTAYAGFVAPTSSTNPIAPINGQLYFNTINQRLEIYYDGAWYTVALYNDVISDTLGDGNGVVQPDILGTLDGGYPSSIYTVTIDGGTPTSFPPPLDGGAASTLVFTETVDGGQGIDPVWLEEYDGGIPSSAYL